MKRNLTVLLAVAILLGVAGCMPNSNDNPAYSAQPVPMESSVPDTIERLS